MWPYWLLFFIPVFFVLSQQNSKINHLPLVKKWTWNWYLIFIVLTIMIGFRYQVGGDWDTYLDKVQLIRPSFSEAVLDGGDPAYNLINWLSLSIGGIFLVNLICALIFSYGLVAFCRTLPFPWLGVTVAIPYLVIVVAMGYSRQGVAIGISMLALAAFKNERVWKYLYLSTVACLFHVSAIVMLPFAALSIKKRRWLIVLIFSLFIFFIFSLLLSEKIDSFTSGYLEAEYSSSGAKIRVWMNAVPCILFLLIRNQIPINKIEKQFWTLISLGGIALIFVLGVSPSSTAVDRVALYWIPIQIYLFSWMPVALKRYIHPHIMILLTVAYYATVQFIWLNYADTAFAWLPYQLYYGQD
jgi:hypothetical protein